jgi:hypothetical protein
MDFFAVMAAARDHYLRIYRDAIAKYRVQFTPSAPEVMIEPTASATPTPYRYYRLDLASGAESPPNLTDVNVDPHALIAPTQYQPLPQLRVTLSTFVWNGLEFVARDQPDNLTALSEWVERWLDVNDTRHSDPDGLAGIIHSTTFPVVDQHGWSFSVDFGSAPVDAVRDLLLTLNAGGVTELRMGSFAYLGETL